jgi:hypothetical protein
MERQSQAKHKNRDERLTIRFTNEEKAEIIEKANACGLKPNEYCRRLILGHKPRLRMTQEEIDAINTLGDARADLIRINNVLKKKSEDFKLQLFGSISFIRLWMQAVGNLIDTWKVIMNRFNQD